MPITMYILNNTSMFIIIDYHEFMFFRRIKLLLCGGIICFNKIVIKIIP